MGRLRNLVGMRFGRLTCVSFAGTRIVGKRKTCRRAVFVCKCDCGGSVDVVGNNLLNGNTESCGCIKKEIDISGDRSRTHGKKGAAIYQCWTDMKRRCMNKAHKAYKWYGARGISVCERWTKFENFYSDMGDVPPGLSLDRIDNDGNYEPTNCKWSTWNEQANNRRAKQAIG